MSYDVNPNELEQQVRKALARGLERDMTAPAFLKTRVLAELDSRKRNRGFQVFGIRLPWLLAPMAGAAAVAFVLFATSSQFQASTNSPVAVRVDLAGVKELAATTAIIEVPEGVTFYSKNRPEIQEQQSLQLALQLDTLSQLPIVIRATDTGFKKVRIKFLNEANHVVMEKTVTIRFETDKRATSLKMKGVWS
jgi:hypothetical protein